MLLERMSDAFNLEVLFTGEAQILEVSDLRFDSVGDSPFVTFKVSDQLAFMDLEAGKVILSGFSNEVILKSGDNVVVKFEYTKKVSPILGAGERTKFRCRLAIKSTHGRTAEAEVLNFSTLD